MSYHRRAGYGTFVVNPKQWKRIRVSVESVIPLPYHRRQRSAD